MPVENYDPDSQMWYPEIDVNSPERQFRYRSEELRLEEDNIDNHLERIEEFIRKLQKDWPGLERNKIRMFTEAESEPYEDWQYGVLIFSFYTLETDEEWKERTDRINFNRMEEIKKLAILVEKYSEEAEALINRRK